MNSDILSQNSTEFRRLPWIAAVGIMTIYFLSAAKFGFVEITVALLAIPILMGLFYAFQQRPALGVGFLIISTSLDMFGRVVTGTVANFTIFHLVFGVLLVAVIWRSLLTGADAWHGTTFDKPLVLFLALICLSLFYTPAQGEAVFTFVRVLGLVLAMYLVANSVHDEKDMRIIWYCIFAGTFILSLIAIWSFISTPSQIISAAVGKEKIFARSQATYEDPNYFANLLLLPTMLTASFLINRKLNPSKRLFYFSIFLIYSVALVATFSRSGWMAMAVGLGFLAFSSKYRWHFILGGIPVVLVALLILSTNPYFRSFLVRFQSIFSGFKDPSVQARIFFIQGGIKMALDTFFIGVGYLGFPEVYPRYRPPSQILVEATHCHSLPIEILAELGLIGLLTFGFIIWRLIKSGIISTKRLEGYGKAFQMGLVAFMISWLTSHLVLPRGLTKNLLWITLGLISAGINLSILGANKNNIAKK